MGDVFRAIEDILRHRDLGKCVVRHVKLEGRDGSYSDFPEKTHPLLIEALAKKKVARPYTHQALAAKRAFAGLPFVVVTPTASGKTLCYNLPVVTSLLEDSDNRALYLFPTKALAQDQLAELRELSDLLPKGLSAHTYDGDTPNDVRRKVRTNAQAVLTNPDMLHKAILPHHPSWARFFKGLRYVVIDEMHVYRGIFGSHMANVLRRLLRLARFHGADPVFLLSSATIANPEELATRLTGDDRIRGFSDSGAPVGEKHFLFLNPPIVDSSIGVRGSPVTLARKVARQFLAQDVQTISFVRSRLQVEVLSRYLKEIVERTPADTGTIRGYRGGYLPLLRREIEAGLKDGSVRGVVSTNALELGIDIGQLEAALLVGYPGSVASTWQQAGRSGRLTDISAAVLIGSSQPLDQYMLKNPSAILERPVEAGLIDPDNLLILASHVQCGAFELPFEEGEPFGEEPVEDILEYLAERGILHKSGSRYHWTEDGYPADKVPLRSAQPENFEVLDTTADPPRVIGEVDFESAPTTIHEGAIYMMEATPHHVDTLDWKARKALVRPTPSDYYTQAISYSKVRILEPFQGRAQPFTRAEWGEVHVSTHVPGYKKIKFYTLENIGYGEVSLPDLEMHTTGAWWTVDNELAVQLDLSTPEFLEGLAGVGYALTSIAALRCLCDARDLDRALGDREGRWSFALHTATPLGETSSDWMETGGNFTPTIFIYERYPGGSGLAEGIFRAGEELLADSLQLIAGCECSSGCPSCVGPFDDTTKRAKSAARRILGALVSRTA